MLHNNTTNNTNNNSTNNTTTTAIITNTSNIIPSDPSERANELETTEILAATVP